MITFEQFNKIASVIKEQSGDPVTEGVSGGQQVSYACPIPHMKSDLGYRVFLDAGGATVGEAILWYHDLRREFMPVVHVMSTEPGKVHVDDEASAASLTGMVWDLLGLGGPE